MINSLIFFFRRYTGLDTKPGAFRPSAEDENYLKMLIRKIQERKNIIKKFIERHDEEDDESGSGSGSAGNCFLLTTPTFWL